MFARQKYIGALIVLIVCNCFLTAPVMAVGGSELNDKESQFYLSISQLKSLSANDASLNVVTTLFQNIWNNNGLQGLLNYNAPSNELSNSSKESLNYYKFLPLELLSKLVIERIGLEHSVLPPAFEAYLFGSDAGIKKMKKNLFWAEYGQRRLETLIRSQDSEVRTLAISSVTKLLSHKMLNDDLLYTLLEVISSKRTDQKAFWDSLSYDNAQGWHILGEVKTWLRKLPVDQLNIIIQWEMVGQTLHHIYPSYTATLLDTERASTNLQLLIDQAKEVKQFPSQTFLQKIRNTCAQAFFKR
jgi:hypothetical protein